jgi:hypothetical protein
VRKRLLLMLNGFFDGSGPGQGHGRYVIAGFVAFAQTWCDIAERWKETLDSTPPIPKFKLSLSRNPTWRGEVGITADQMKSRIKKLSRLVTPPQTLFSVVCSINADDFTDAVEASQIKGNKDVRVALGEYAFSTSYSMLFHSVVARTLWKVHDLGICGDQVDFVFDRENHLFDDAKKLLDLYRHAEGSRGLPPEIAPLLGDAIQRDEDKLMPLQAADLLAGLAKDHCNDPQNHKSTKTLLALAGTGDHNTTLHHKRKRLIELIHELCAASDRNTSWSKYV